MLRLFQLLQLLAAALPVIHQSVQIAEQIFPGANKGAEKLEHVTSVVEAALPAVGATLDQAQQLRAPIQAIIGTVVAGMNSAGTLKPPAPVTPAS